MADAELDIDDMAVSGDGVGSVDGRAVLVPFTIPGERVRVGLARGRPVATLLSIVRASPHRVTPRCAHFGPDAERGLGPCGGCSWQHIAYPEQLRLKRRIVDRLVRDAVSPAPAIEPMRAATPVDEPWGYRHKAHFVFAPVRTGRHAAIAMGHYARGSRRLVPVRECPVHDARGNALAFSVRDRLGRLPVSPRDQAPALRGLAVRAGFHTSELMATLVVRHTGDTRVRGAMQDVMRANPSVSFHLNVHADDDAFIFGRQTRRLSGPERMREQVQDSSFLISPTAFFQTNVAAADLLVELVLAAMPPRSRVLDLYAGAGLFAIPLARAGHTVTAVEGNRAAVADGIASARLNGVDESRCRFVARPVEQALGAATADAVVLDPPREGCAPAVIDRLFGGIRPRVGVYVSCNPEALAADLRRIVACGYTIRSIQPVDMFPHTAHIEAVAVVSR